ncbi:MAG: tRNA (guanosine(37)-N1)-methyltransferase TrmD [Verrucomicrobia bacterium]|nr:tRNA (guanosine(37)-N1)-methyltransferase TrmD [Verrucomicrobiota bacterium]MDA0858832.1 tRNA (guanosine(37)-N1)-methyltransferase TrmD [Verrucomicrobiota bacterium]MDA1341085.1 tRNA (guanosine(37)-N1)-methyltransferase TrmD [Verrucomicrobiota bacterium]
MKIDLLTLFPAMANGVLAESILGRAQRAGLVEIRVHQIRDYAKDKHHTVDDRPFGGGPGMVMKAEPLVDAIEHLRGEGQDRAHVIYVTPEGARLDQAKVVQLGREHRHLLLISGHYEGIDERVREGWIDEEISVGDYVLSNGTLPALTLIDAMVRLIPGVLGNDASAGGDSFGEEGLLEGPQYTRPEEFRGRKVPEILLSGHHAEISKWQKSQALARTRERRGDLLGDKKQAGFTLPKEKKI